MISLLRPSPKPIDAYLARCREQPFSYPEVGASRDDTAPPGYVVDHRRILVGLGEQAFQAACECLRRWDMFQLGWVTPCWPHHAAGTRRTAWPRSSGWPGRGGSTPAGSSTSSSEPRRFRFAYGTVARPRREGRGALHRRMARR